MKFEGIRNDSEAERASTVTDPFGRQGHSAARRAIQSLKSEAKSPAVTHCTGCRESHTDLEGWHNGVLMYDGSEAESRM